MINRVKAYLRVITGEREINRQLSEINERLQQEVEIRKHVEETLKHLNEELREASKYKTNYLSNMSHELRSPLNALIGYISLSLSNLQPYTTPEQLENLVKADQTVIGDSDAMGVAAEILQDLFRSGERTFGIDDPIELARLSETAREGGGLAQASQIAREPERAGGKCGFKPLEEQAPVEAGEHPHG